MNAPVQSWPSRTHRATFVHTLHLLDLDQLQDWPEVTLQTFSAKASLQHRIRCVEWSLYRLFELYDGRATRDKLRPHFPPATALQSVNLRAALLRQLTELRKDGVLGHNAILRKTMLDECKGDKFEELLANFSIVVLKKTLYAKADAVHVIRDAGPAHRLPLIISYRKGIQRDFEKRKDVKVHATQQHRNLDAAIHAISDEAAKLENRQPPAVPENAVLLKRMVRENWIGDPAWVESLVYDVPPSRRTKQELPETDRWEENPSTLLTELDARIDKQSARVAKWQSYLKDLQKQKPKNPVMPLSEDQAQSKPGRFSRHQDLALHSRQAGNIEQRLDSQHASLLQTLDRELAPWLTIRQVSSKSISTALVSSSQPSTVMPNMSHAQPTQPEVYASGISSQETVFPEQDAEQTPITAERDRQLAVMASSRTQTSPDETPKPPLSLQERTRQSLAQFETPRPRANASKTVNRYHGEPGPTAAATSLKTHSDRTSLLERTRQSMSILANFLDEGYEPQSNPRSKRPTHARSQTTLHVPSQRRKLERAWSEESLASIATKDELDLNADYDTVFRSRPRLAMSPNLSPQRTDNDLWLESQLEEGMNRLTIESSPEY